MVASGGREGDADLKATIGAVAGEGCPTVGVGDTSHDGESEPGTWEGLRRIGAVEAVEDPAELRLGNSRPRIAHGDRPLSNGDRDRSVSAGELHGVLAEVGDGALECLRQAEQYPVIATDREVGPMAAVHLSGDPLGEVEEIEFLVVLLAGAVGGDVDDLVDETGELFEFGL